MKKFIAILCTLCMIATMVPFSAMAEETVISGTFTDSKSVSFTWSLDTATGAFTVDGTGDMYLAANPWNCPSADAPQLPWVNYNGTDYRSQIKSVTIGSGITRLGRELFYGCTALTEVTIPGNVKGSGWGLFSYCNNLKSVTFEEGFKDPNDKAFQYCTSLTEINLPNSLTRIGANFVLGCTNLKTLTLPKNVNLNQNTFGDNKSGEGGAAVVPAPSGNIGYNIDFTVYSGSAAETYLDTYYNGTIANRIPGFVHDTFTGSREEVEAGYSLLKSGKINLIPADSDTPGGYDCLNGELGGKSSDDYYIYADYDNTYDNYLIYGLSGTELSSKYLAFKYNLYGLEGGLYLKTRLGSGKNPELYRINDTEKVLLKDGVWNSCMIVVELSTSKAWGYINGVKTHVKDFTSALTAYDETWTTLSATPTDRFMLYGHGNNEEISTGYMRVDDVSVVSAEAEPVPPTTTVTSTAMAYGDAIISADGTVSNLASDGNTVIVYNGTNTARAATTAVTDNVVSVEYTDATYGTMYQNYTVKTELGVNKFYDGSSNATAANHGFMFVSNTVSTVDEVGNEIKESVSIYTGSEANQLGGKQADDYYAVLATKSGEQPAYTSGNNTFSTRFCTMSFNVYGKGLNKVFARIESTVKPELLPTAKNGTMVANRWNNVFIVFDNLTKDIKSYINGSNVYEANLYTLVDTNQYWISRDGDTLKCYSDTKKTNIVTKPVSISDIRICFATDTRVYFDDCATLYTDYEPVPYDNATSYTLDNAKLNGNFAIITNETAASAISADGATTMVNNGSAWNETNTIEADNTVMFITKTPYGNIYSTTYLNVLEPCEGTLKDTAGVEGAFKWVVDPNAGTLVISKTDVASNGQIQDFEEFLDAEKKQPIAPWYNLTSKSWLTKVVVEEGIVRIPPQLMRSNGAKAHVTLPSTMRYAGAYVFNAAKVSELYIKEGASLAPTADKPNDTVGNFINDNCNIDKIIFPSTFTPADGMIRDFTFGTRGAMVSKSIVFVAPYNSPAYNWAEARKAQAEAKEDAEVLDADGKPTGELKAYCGMPAENITITPSYETTACADGVVTVANNTGYPVDSAYVIIGYYDGTGNLMAAKLSDKLTLADASNTVTLDTVADAAKTVVFVWNNMTDLKPLANIYEK